jgi:hypothetical protein
MKNLKERRRKKTMSDEEKLDYENMDGEQLLDALHENPKCFVGAIASQVRADLERETEERAEENRYIRTYQDFARENPDFEAMWESGKIKEYMDEHAGHNALSAYLNITQDERIKEAVQSKLAEKGLSDQSALGNSKKFGGDTRVLADRLRALRSGGPNKGLPTKGAESGELKATL